MEHKTKEEYIAIKSSPSVGIGSTGLKAYIYNGFWYLIDWGCPYIGNTEKEAIDWCLKNKVRYNAYTY